MKNLDGALTWLLDCFTWIRDFEVSQWKQIMITYPNSKCKLCGKVVETGETAMSQKGVGILHIFTCYEECCDYACLRDNAITKVQQTIFNHYRGLK